MALGNSLVPEEVSWQSKICCNGLPLLDIHVDLYKHEELGRSQCELKKTNTIL